MNAAISVGSVGAGLSQAQFQSSGAVRSLKDQPATATALGAVALELVRSAMSSMNTAATQQHDLDVKA